MSLYPLWNDLSDFVGTKKGQILNFKFPSSRKIHNNDLRSIFFNFITGQLILWLARWAVTQEAGIQFFFFKILFVSKESIIIMPNDGTSQGL